jgi:amidase
MTGPAPLLGASNQNDPSFTARGWFDHVFGVIAPFTAPFNATGQPAMSMPLAEDDAGRPVGMQFVARFGDEATLFRLAAQLEQARPWAGRLPELSDSPG